MQLKDLQQYLVDNLPKEGLFKNKNKKDILLMFSLIYMQNSGEMMNELSRYTQNKTVDKNVIKDTLGRMLIFLMMLPELMEFPIEDVEKECIDYYNNHAMKFLEKEFVKSLRANSKEIIKEVKEVNVGIDKAHKYVRMKCNVHDIDERVVEMLKETDVDDSFTIEFDDVVFASISKLEEFLGKN